MSKEKANPKDLNLNAAHAPLGQNRDLLIELRALIEQTRSSIATAVNAGITLLYWEIGKRINDDILQAKRASYGEEIVSTLSRQLSWSHFKEIIYVKDPLKKDFYAEMCRIERWSVRTLRAKIDSMLYERTALSKKPDEIIQQELAELKKEDRISPDLVFRDPVFLDFLGLKDRYLEKDLEDAILRELELFLLELGSGFAFIGRQKRIQIDNDDYYIDLLFFHRSLNRLIAIDLKLGDFKASDKGQMELYLRWLNKHEKRSEEQEPLGIILCAGKKQELVELLELDSSGIHVAEYLTELPPRELLEQKLHNALHNASARFEARPETEKKGKR